MVTPLAAAQLVYSGYWPPNRLTHTVTIDAVTAFTGIVGGDQVLLFPGSESLTDWQRDFMSVEMTQDPQLGPVGDGFILGLRDVLSLALKTLDMTKPITIIGHSLGAARALLAAAELIIQKVDPSLLSVFTFGSPCPGGQKLADILAPVTITSYRNGSDEVCSVLTNLPSFVHPRPLIPCSCQPMEGDLWAVFRWHHHQLYLAAMGLAE